jgi:hypothetical protein
MGSGGGLDWKMESQVDVMAESHEAEFFASLNFLYRI